MSDSITNITETAHVPEAAIVAGIAAQAAKREVIVQNGVPILTTPENVRIHSLENLLPQPLRPSIQVALHTARDLHAYIIEHTQLPPLASETAGLAQGTATAPVQVNFHHPVIFADRQSLALVGFIDYHHAGSPRWLEHKAQVAFKHSHQFKRWKEADGKQMSQDQFVDFIDEVVNDIDTPPGADVLSFAQFLETTSSQKFSSSIKPSSGEVKFTFTDERQGDSSTSIIEEFVIGIPIWQGAKPVAIKAKMYHRIITHPETQAKSLKFWFKLRHLEEITDKLFAEEVEFLQTAFKDITPIYQGTAPSTPAVTDLPGSIEV